MHAIAHGGWTDTVRESALEVDSGRKEIILPHSGLEPTSLSRQAFQSDALPTELYPRPTPPPSVVRTFVRQKKKILFG